MWEDCEMSLSRYGHAVQIVGHLGRDPELRYLPDGKPVCNFSLASGHRWQDAGGEHHEQTIWWRVSAFGKLADVCNQYLAKGRQVLVEGHLRPGEGGNPRVFQRSDGNPSASYELTATEVRFLGGRGDGTGAATLPPGDPADAPAMLEDERIPF
jgi:single-strand DNA-binding protein